MQFRGGIPGVWGAILLACACAGTAGPPIDLEQAWIHLRDVAAEDPDFALVEGGVSVQALQYEWRERWEHSPPMLGLEPDLGREDTTGPRLIRERILVGRAPQYVAFAGVAGATPLRWLSGAGVEVELIGIEQSVVFRLANFDRAKRVAAALDAIARRRGEAR